ncbi:hypothetical protein PIB30_001955 [Stylosanthes scabra]|uniref:Uncharacterized protein n=1 Tax=Stylosanthes scabra TaxID=79078 RepID=A0ABU6Y334_9FABA|nr:hypothetical protein [Stylosanthes scabra]
MPTDVPALQLANSGQFNSRSSDLPKLHKFGATVLDLGPARPKQPDTDSNPAPSPTRDTDWTDEPTNHPTYAHNAISPRRSLARIQKQPTPNQSGPLRVYKGKISSSLNTLPTSHINFRPSSLAPPVTPEVPNP